MSLRSSNHKLTCSLGIDVGTSAVKALLAADDGSVAASASAPCAVQHPAPGWAEVHPRHWWQAAVHAVRALDPAGRGVCVRGIGISVLYPALVLFDEAMQPLRPAILYCDQRSAAESQALLTYYGEREARKLTGNLFPAGSTSITSLLWLRRREPDVIRRAAWIGHADTFIVWRLAGERTIDFSSASLTGLCDAGRNTWCGELCEIAGVKPGQLPRLLPGTAVAGQLSAQAADELGLPAGLPVAAGAGDTACSVLGVGAGGPDELFLSCGSTNNFVRLADQPQFDNGLVNTSYLDAHHWLNVGTTNASGAAVQWFVDTYLGPGEYERFFALCAASKPGAGGIIFVPYLAGERTPWYDPRAKAMFFGVTASSTLADTARSVAEGVCYADRHILETFERPGRAVQKILATGGGNRSEVMRRIRTDITGREIVFSGMADASAYGAALLGAIAGGRFAGWQDAAAVARTFAQGSALRPDAETGRSYENAYRIYTQLYPRMRDLYLP